jgi:hypothetical protein
MYLEGAGAATAAAGGFMLRQAFKVNVTNTNNTERKVEIDGSVVGSLINEGDIHGNATMTVGAQPRAAPASPPAAATPKPKGRSIGLIVLGSCLLFAGILMICTGLYINREYSRV